jgi:Trp operon repressor
MPQVSRRRLPTSVWDRLWRIWIASIEQSGKSRSAEVFFKGILTPTERKMLTKRFVALVLLASKWEPVAVAEHLKMSISTVYKLKGQLRLSPQLKTQLSGVAGKVKPEVFTRASESSLLEAVEMILTAHSDRARILGVKLPKGE